MIVADHIGLVPDSLLAKLGFFEADSRNDAPCSDCGARLCKIYLSIKVPKIHHAIASKAYVVRLVPPSNDIATSPL